MKITFLNGRMLLAAIALIGGVALASACNDDGEALTLEEYFERVEELDNEQRATSGEIEQDVEELGEDASVDEVADAFSRQIDAVEEFRDGLADLEPPDEAAAAHDEAVESLERVLDQFESFIEEFRQADTVEEGFALFDEADFSDRERADQACRDLEQIAADNNIEVDLDCEDE